MKKKRGKSAKKARAATAGQAREEEFAKAPHSFVFHRGHAGKHMKELVRDFRRVMEPYTASNLQLRKTNTLRDVTSLAGVLHVTHCVMFTKTDLAPYVRMMRLPRGPTLTFKIHEYCLGRDVVSALRKPNVNQGAFQTHPLLVMNNLSGDEAHLKLMSTMFQNMFPSINVNKVNLNGIKRCVLVNYNKDTKLLDIRHYLIRVSPVGVSKGIKKLMRTHLPDMGRYSGLDEYIEKGGNLSESENEMDGPHNEVVLPQEVGGRGNIKSTQSAIRLKEVGPRLTLQLVKIEEGICDGVVMFHEFVHKSLEEQQSITEMRAHKRKLREKRKQQQLANVQRKQKLKEEHKEKSLKGMKKKDKAQGEEGKDAADGPSQGGDSEEESDTEYFRKEVGSNPEEGLFSSGDTRRKRKRDNSAGPAKKKFKEGKPAPPSKKSQKGFTPKSRNFQSSKMKNTKGRERAKSGNSAQRVRFQTPGGSKEKSRGPKTKKAKMAGGKPRKFQSKQKKKP